MKRFTHLRRLPLVLAIILVIALLVVACGAATKGKATATKAATTSGATATKVAGTAAPTTAATKASGTVAPTTAATKAAAPGTAAATTAPTKAAASGTAAPTTAATKPAASGTAVPATAAAATKPATTTGVSFKTDVLPIFQKSCTRCHGGTSPRGGMSLETYQNVIKGGNNAPDLVPGAPTRSVLCTYPTDGTMPLGGPKIAATDAQKICDWITQGALNN
jgi:cytoskeletal protein RodZ